MVTYLPRLLAPVAKFLPAASPSSRKLREPQGDHDIENAGLHPAAGQLALPNCATIPASTCRGRLLTASRSTHTVRAVTIARSPPSARRTSVNRSQVAPEGSPTHVRTSNSSLRMLAIRCSVLNVSRKG